MRNFLIVSLFCFFSTLCYGFEETPECFNKLERSFFASDATLQALSIHNVQQSSWTLIYDQLQRATALVTQRVREKARRLPVNPLNRPFDPDKSWEILEQTLFEVFLQILRDHNTFHQYNDPSIRDMFDYIKQQHAQEINDCLSQKKRISSKLVQKNISVM